MGEPANPTPSERAERQKLAAAIVESVRDDEKMPLPGLKAIAVQYKGVFFDAVEVEEFVFHLAHEITLLKTPEFAECASCAAKPGAPTLCQACLHNRATINPLRAECEALTTGYGSVARRRSTDSIPFSKSLTSTRELE